MPISPLALAALSLHNAARAVSGRFDGSWWVIHPAKWELIPSPQVRSILSSWL